MILHDLPNSSTEYDMIKKDAQFRTLEDRRIKNRRIAGISSDRQFSKCLII